MAAAKGTATSAKEAAAKGATGCCCAGAAIDVFVPMLLFGEIAMGAAIGVMVCDDAQTFVSGCTATDFLHLILVTAGAVSLLALLQPDGKTDAACSECYVG